MNIFNRRLSVITAAVVCTLAVPAHAFIPATTAPQLEIFIAGSSSSSIAMREQVINNYCDNALPIDLFVDEVYAPPSATKILEHFRQWAVACIAGPTQAAAGQRVLIRKSDDGGSGRGVVLVDEPTRATSPQKFQDLSGIHCPVTGTLVTSIAGGANYTYYDCDGAIVSQIPDAGISDIEPGFDTPGKFVGPLSPGGINFKALNITKASTFPGPGLVFGVAVTKSLRDELQTDQIASGHLAAGCVGQETPACQPAVTDAYLTAVFSGGVNNWSGTQVLDGLAPDVPAAWTYPKKNRVHICRRVNGAGAHAQHAIHYHKTNCLPGPPMKPQPDCIFGSCVFEGSAAADVGNCLHALDTGTGYINSGITPMVMPGVQSFGIGYLSLERNTSLSKNWRYVKVKNGDMLANNPTLRNAYDASYPQMYFMSFQYRDPVKPQGVYFDGPGRLLHITGANQAALTVAGNTAFRNAFQDIGGRTLYELNASFVHSFGQSGYLVSTHINPSGPVPAPFSHITPWQRVIANTTTPDSCQVLTLK